MIDFRLGEFRQINQHRFLIHASKTYMLAIMTKGAYGCQICQTVIVMVVIKMVDFLIFTGLKAAALTRIVIALKSTQPHLDEILIRFISKMVSLSPVLGFYA
jgi:hypothetical protein